jgi:hypothetical protein
MMLAVSSFRLSAAVALCGLVCMSAFAQSQSSRPAAAFSAAQRQTVLNDILAVFEQQYVFPEMRPRIAERLKSAERDGRYATDDANEFAERVTEDLREVSNDKHLSLSVDPAGYAAATAQGHDDQSDLEVWQRLAVRDHHGLTEMKILGGNVRYLRISRFDWINDQTGAAYDSAMRFLKQGDAAIIDIRGNGGGAHSAVQYLVSHFMDGDVLEMTFLEGAETPAQSRTLENLPAGRLKGMPLYVLIDRSSASAAEAFAYDVQQFKLGELIGSKTIGAANNNKLLPIAPNFILSVSYGRPVHPISNTNWEGMGVAPSIEAPPSQALEVAHALALKRLSEKEGVSAENLAAYDWAKVAVDASLKPVSLSPARLRSLAGNYGTTKVEFRDGALWITRPDRETVRMSLLTSDGLFAVERVEGMRVRLTGRTMELLRPGAGKPQIIPRS